MDLSETFEELFEQNPYSRELLELLRSAKSNPGEAPRLLGSFNTKVTTDIELERRVLNSRIVSLRLSPSSPNTLAEMKSIIEEFFDIAARRRLWGVAYSPNLEQAYVDFLNQQKQADAGRWARVTLVMGDDTVDMILEGRVAYWTVQAKEQARRMRHHAVVSAPSVGSATEPEGNARRPPADEALAAINTAMREKGMTLRRLADEMRPKVRKLDPGNKVEKSAINRVLKGETKQPHPAIKKVLPEMFGFPPERVKELKRALKWE
jgi:hypothetical protein